MSQSNVTMDQIRDYFSLSAKLEPLHIAPTATGGMGLASLDGCSKVEVCRPRITRGTDYVQEELEKAREMQAEEAMQLPCDSNNEMDRPEELSTMSGEIPNCDDLSAEELQESYAKYYKDEVKYNPNLPITSYRKEILSLIDINRVLIIQGSTGCGKTTQVPQYILDDCAEKGRNCNIIVTQPRKIAAVSIARRVCNERRWQLGTMVGYKVGLEDRTSPDTRLAYVTTGVLLQKLISERRISKYTHVIIDEVHERDQDTDFVLLVARKLINTNSAHVKVILMSATINTALFANYFTLTQHRDPARVIEIYGKVQEVTEYYIGELAQLKVEIPSFDKNKPCIPDQLYDLVVNLMTVFDQLDRSEIDYPDTPGSYRGAVLIFLPGYEEISNMYRKLKLVAVARKFSIIPLHSSITVEEQGKVFNKPEHGFRKVIISTNIAESSITVPDIKYVIDFCLTKSSVCDPETNYTCLRLEWASKSNCTQRKGRAGRVSMGRVYRLVPKEFYDKCIPEFGIPEIQHTSLTQLVLYTKKLDLGAPKHLLAQAISPPELYGIEHAILTLKEVGALMTTVNRVMSAVDGDLTFIGRVMYKLPLDVRVSKLIILGYVFGCLEECVIIAASLTLKSFLAKAFDRALEFYKSSVSWADGTYSDCFALLNAYTMWRTYTQLGEFKRPGGQSEESWCRQNFIQIKRIKEVDLLVKELKGRLERINIQVCPSSHHMDKLMRVLLLKIVIAGAFFPNYYIQDEMDEKTALREISNGDIYSTVWISGLPANHGVLYFHAIQEMMSVCSPRISIEFEGRKANIRFDRRVMEWESDAAVSTIHPAVYLAVKMRLMRQKLSLMVFRPEDAERRMKQLWNRQESYYKNNSNKLASDRLVVQPTSYTCVKKVDLPSINQVTITIFITHFVNCGKFWARYSDQEKNNLLVYVENLINPPDNPNLLRVSNDLVCGILVLAPYSDNKRQNQYYRATVEEIMPHNVLVFYIDYGNTKMVEKKFLRQVDYRIYPDVYDVPALAFECQLSQVKPSSIKSFQWSEESCKWFQHVTRNKTLNAKVYSVVQTVVRIELFSLTPSGTEFSVNNELIERGFAEAAEESLLSRQNCELREQQDKQMLSLPVDMDAPFQLTTNDLQGTQNAEKLGLRVHLKGPYSPLEVSYSGISYIDHFKTIKVDSDSVNSVSLNREPQDKNPQMLVASTVSLNSLSDSITLRGTTLIPKIKGIQSLLCLIFAPYAEFRTDPELKTYTGALCGLGFDPNTGAALSPDHDIEVAFDIILNNIDIIDLNAIRMGINLILGNQTDIAETQQTYLNEMQEKLQRALTNWIKKKRVPKEPCYFPKSYMWDQMNSEHVLNPQLEESAADCPYVLPLHKGINLNTNSLEEDLKKQVRELHNIAERSLSKIETTCPLCSVSLTTRRMLLLHLDSASHIEKDKLLFGSGSCNQKKKLLLQKINFGRTGFWTFSTTASLEKER